MSRCQVKFDKSISLLCLSNQELRLNKTTGQENFSMSHLQVNLGSSMLIRMGPPSVKQKGDIKKKMLKKSA